MRLSNISVAALLVSFLGGGSAGCGGDTAPSSTATTSGSGGSAGSGAAGGNGGTTTGGGAGTSASGGTTGSGGATTSGGAGGSGSGGTTGSGGCSAAIDCPSPDNECLTPTCVDGQCGTFPVAADTPLAMQVAGDCQAAACDGLGDAVLIYDDADLPDDANPCTDDVCADGVAANPPLAAATACGAGMLCDGDGACVACLTAADCPGQDGPCQARTCTDNACGIALVDVGIAIEMQTAGDCKLDVCDGQGAVASSDDDSDLPVDANDCTDDVCTDGAPANPPLAAATACGAAMLCDGNGACVGCLTVNDCPGQDGPCQSRTCIAGACGIALVPAGTPVGAQTTGDCKVNQCNGAGAKVVANDGSDLPVDNNTCTGDVCAAGVPSNPALAVGTTCNQGGGAACNGAGLCIPTFVVARVGDGALALTANATQVFLEERLLTGALLVKANNPNPLPTVVSGNNRPLTLAGNAGSEGNLSLSGNGSYLTIAGYDAAVGVVSVAATTAALVNRVVARIDAAGNIDSSTRLDGAFSASNVRSATTTDGLGFWVTGNGGGGTGGLHYSVLGVTGSNQILTLPNNTRFCQVQEGQLWATGSATPSLNVNAIGAGTPFNAGQTATPLPGMLGTVASPYSFAFFDRNANIPGVDTLYVADDRATASGGGVQKWTFDGTNWNLITTFINGVTAGSRGLAGTITGNNVTLVATTTNNRVVVYVDTGVLAPTGTIVATAALNTAYRGIAFSPK